jgi:hypothetical protein
MDRGVIAKKSRAERLKTRREYLNIQDEVEDGLQESQAQF